MRAAAAAADPRLRLQLHALLRLRPHSSRTMRPTRHPPFPSLPSPPLISHHHHHHRLLVYLLLFLLLLACSPQSSVAQSAVAALSSPPCTPSSCLNGGVCYPSVNHQSATCVCPAQYFGSDCSNSLPALYLRSVSGLQPDQQPDNLTLCFTPSSSSSSSGSSIGAAPNADSAASAAPPTASSTATAADAPSAPSSTADGGWLSVLTSSIPLLFAGSSTGSEGSSIGEDGSAPPTLLDPRTPPATASSSSSSAAISAIGSSTASPSAASGFSSSAPESLSSSSSSSFFSSVLPLTPEVCVNESAPAPPLLSDVTVIAFPFHSTPSFLQSINVSFANCSQTPRTSYLTVASVLYTAAATVASSSSPPPSPFLFSLLTATNFSFTSSAHCPSSRSFEFASPLPLDASHTVALYFPPGLSPALVYTGEPALLFVYGSESAASLSSGMSFAESTVSGYSLLSSSLQLQVEDASTSCPAGYYLSAPSSPSSSITCSECPAGSYVSSASSFESCFLCPPGSWSAVGSGSCSACLTGFYQPDWAAAACPSCPPGFASSAGSSTCFLCPPGSFSSGAASPDCQLCPTGFYSAQAGSTGCTACPSVFSSVSTTEGPGSVSLTNCSVLVDLCASLGPVCGNGSCVDSVVPGQWSCSCNTGWTGSICSSPLPNTVENGSSTGASNGEASVPSSSGSSSSGSISSSQLPSSQPTATAMDSSLSLSSSSLYSLESSSASSGVAAHDCPCLNNGSCVFASSSSQSFVCSCLPGFAGALCSDCVSEYYSPDCLPCTALCLFGLCNDGVDGDGSCVCESGWTGVSCDQCAPGFWGEGCTACPACQHGSCDDGSDGSGLCLCNGYPNNTDWTGALCDIPQDGALVSLDLQVSVFVSPLLASFVTVQLSGAPSGFSEAFYSRVETLPNASTLWQTTDGITPVSSITTANSQLTDKLNRVLWQPPQHVQPGLVDSFTFSVGVSGFGYSRTPGTVSLTVVAPPCAPVLSVPERLQHVGLGATNLSGLSLQGEYSNQSQQQLRLTVAAWRGSLTFAPALFASVVNFTLPANANANANVSLSNSTASRARQNFSSAAAFTVIGSVAVVNATLQSLVYAPPLGYTGLDSLAITVSNMQPQLWQLLPVTTSATLLLAVDPPPQPPVLTAGNETVIVFEYTTSRLPVVSVSDAGVGVNFLSVEVSCSHGVLALDSSAVNPEYLLLPAWGDAPNSSLTFTADVQRVNSVLHNLTYSPVPPYAGNDSIVVVVSTGGLWSSLTLAVEVVHVNRSANARSVQLSLQEDGRAVFALNSSSLDESESLFVYVVVAPPPSWCGALYQVIDSDWQPVAGAPVLESDTEVTDSEHRLLFMLAPYAVGSPLCSFEYYVHDVFNVSSLSPPAAVTVSVSPVNQPPTALPVSVFAFHNEDALVSLSASDPDSSSNSAPLLFFIDSLPAHGTLYQYSAAQVNPRSLPLRLGQQLSDAEGRLVYEPDYGVWGAGGAMFDSFLFSCGDGQSVSVNSAQVSLWLQRRVQPVVRSLQLVTNANSAVQLQFLPDDSQWGVYNITQVDVLSAPSAGLLFPSAALTQPIQPPYTIVASPSTCTPPSVWYQPPPGNADAVTTFTYQLWNGPLLSDVGLVTIIVRAVATPAAAVDVNVSRMLPSYTVSLQLVAAFNASSTIIRINSLPSTGHLQHHDANIVHPDGQVISSCPTLLTDPHAIVDYAPADPSADIPFAVSFTFSVATAPLFLFSPPATARLYLGSVDVLPQVQTQTVTVAAQAAVVITLSGSGFDAYRVVIDSLPSYGALYAMNGTEIVSAGSAVQDPQHRVIYSAAALQSSLQVIDSFTVYGVSLVGNAGSKAAISVTVQAANSPPVATSQWLLAAENVPLLVTLDGWDAEDGTLDSVILSLPSEGYLYLCVNGSAALGDWIHELPFAISAAASGVNGRTQVWFEPAFDAFSIPSAASEVYSSFQYGLVDSAGLVSNPATVTLSVQQSPLAVANVAVQVSGSALSLVTLSGEGDSAVWYAVVLTLPAGQLRQVAEDGTVGAAISAVPALVTHPRHLLFYSPCYACTAQDSFLYAAQATAVIDYSQPSASSSTSLVSFGSSTAAEYSISSAFSSSSLSLTQADSSAEAASSGGSSISSSPWSGAGNQSSGLPFSLSSTPSSSLPFVPSSSSSLLSSDSQSSSSATLQPALPPNSSSGVSGLVNNSSSGLWLSSSTSSPLELGSSSSSLGEVPLSLSSSTVTEHSSPPVIINLSPVANATLLLGPLTPTPAPANITVAMNESTSANFDLPPAAVLTRLPRQGKLAIHSSSGFSSITSVPWPVNGRPLSYEPPAGLYGLQLNNWVLDYLLYFLNDSLPAAAAAPVTSAFPPPSLYTCPYPIMVSLAVLPVLQPPVALDMQPEGDENSALPIQLQYVDGPDASSLRAVILTLPTFGRLCQLSTVNDTLCGQVMSAGPADERNQTVSIEVSDPSFRVVYVPGVNWYGDDSFTWQMQDSLQQTVNTAAVNISIRHVNQPPVPVPVHVELSPSQQVVFITLNASDPDQSWWSLRYELLSLPGIGWLNQSYQLLNVTYNEIVQVGQQLRNQTLLYSTGDMGSAQPFPNITYRVTDDSDATADSVVSFSVSCPPGLVNNVFTRVGPVCVSCPVGAACSQQGAYLPFTQAGYWPSDLNTAYMVVYVPCQPSSACVGGSWPTPSSDLCSVGFTDWRCGDCHTGFYKLNGVCSSCPVESSFWETVIIYLLPAGAVLGLLLLLISKLRLEVTFFTIGINFFQLLSAFSTFSLNWPDPTHSLFSSVSFINFNVDLLALECHFPGITYEAKWLVCILFPAAVALLMLLFSYSSAVVVALLYWLRTRLRSGGSEQQPLSLQLSPRPSSAFLAPAAPPTRFSALLRRQLSVHHSRFTWAFHTFLVVVFLSLAMKSFEMLQCSELPDGTYALVADPAFRCDLPSYTVWRNLAILSVCVYVIGIPLWLGYVMFRLRPPVSADSVCGGLLFVPRSERRARELRRIARRSGQVAGAEGFVLAQQLQAWSRKYSTLTAPFNHEHYYWAIAIVLRNLIVAVISIVCSTLPLYQACLTLLTLALAVLLQVSRRPYRLQSGMNELELASLSCAILILFLGILFYAELGDVNAPSNVLAWLTLGLVAGFCCITAALVYRQIRHSWRDICHWKGPRGAEQPQDGEDAAGKEDADRWRLKVKTMGVGSGESWETGEGKAGKKKTLPASGSSSSSSSSVEMTSMGALLLSRGKAEETAGALTTQDAETSCSRLESAEVGELKEQPSEQRVEEIELMSLGQQQPQQQRQHRSLPVGDSKQAVADLESVRGEGLPADQAADGAVSDDEEQQVEGDREDRPPAAALVKRVVTFPAPLPILTPLTLTAANASVSRGDSREAGSQDEQIWFIDHSHLTLPQPQPQGRQLRFRHASESKDRAEGEAEDESERHKRAVLRWQQALVMVKEQRDAQRSSHSRTAIYVLRKAPSASSGDAASSSSSLLSFPLIPSEGEAEAEKVFRLTKRRQASGGGVQGAELAASQSLAAAPSRAAPRRASVLRRPSISLSSSLAPLSSVLSEVSNLSASSASALDDDDDDPLSHFVVPPAAQRHRTPAFYHHHKQQQAQAQPVQPQTAAVPSLPAAAAGVTVIYPAAANGVGRPGGSDADSSSPDSSELSLSLSQLLQ